MQENMHHFVQNSTQFSYTTQSQTQQSLDTEKDLYNSKSAITKHLHCDASRKEKKKLKK